MLERKGLQQASIMFRHLSEAFELVKAWSGEYCTHHAVGMEYMLNLQSY